MDLKGVRHWYAGTTGESEVDAVMIAGIDTLAEFAFRIALVLKL